MKCFHYTISTVFLAASLLLTACEENTFQACEDEAPAYIRVSTAPMTLVGEQVPYADTRADQSLPPEYENSIYSLTVLVFDVKEGVLGKFPVKDGQQKLYKYINLKDANGNGLLNTTLPVEDFPVVEGEEYTVCLIANLTEEQVETMIGSMLEDGTVFFDEFKKYSIQIPYVTTPGQGDDAGLEAGHVRDIYMFGYYRGEVSSHKDITISLGRIISRLEIAFSFDESKLQQGKSLYILLDNLELRANLFPTGISPGEYVEQSAYEVQTLDELQNSTIYLYAAPNSAQTAAQALCLKMWYADKRLSPGEVERMEPNATVHLCNDQPGVENRNYQLNRNSVYHFNLHLK
ncbi:hypothetical protein HMPREF1069_05021 [Bacteroides ovatus CL02T12C04]|uniref:hypothetical protein n=1 Tax=Bacteroides ovatus TaxID=28116 RepID=UPI000268F5C0|nr:hypothetical protein [Bacteroides ovatus]EIY57706.1 hypothetical protein HMPREF1069_05021 [Bacteroides ovatus CL02T12C04]